MDQPAVCVIVLALNRARYSLICAIRRGFGRACVTFGPA